jgi:hypothetical protein
MVSDCRGWALFHVLRVDRPLISFGNSSLSGTGDRAGVTGQPMLPVGTRLRIGDLIDVVAYAASVEP